MNLKSIFSKVLPTITATVIPGSPLALMGINAVAKVLGADKIDPTPDALDAAITEAQGKNPEILLELKKADAELQIRLTEMGFDSEEKILALQNADRSDARAREIAVKDRTPMILAFSVTVGFFGMLALLAFVKTEPTSHDVLLTMTGSLALAWSGIVGYYFGSSSGSAKKTELLAAKPDDK